jgi:hypothetical protein
LIASLKQLTRPCNSIFERKLGIEEHASGLPAKEGQYREINILIPRQTQGR